MPSDGSSKTSDYDEGADDDDDDDDDASRVKTRQTDGL